MVTAPVGAIAALLIAYPLAYFLAVRVDPKWKTILLVLVIVAFWTSILIRSYAWIFLLVGIIYGYLPLMVFPLFVSLDRLDKRLLEASSDLGASPWRMFVKSHCRCRHRAG